MSVSIDPDINRATIPLRPEEKLISAYYVKSKKIAKPITAMTALTRLARVDRIEKIATQGPLMASMAFDDQEERSELRRYQAVFGRDSLLTATFLLDLFPQLAKSTLQCLAKFQGIKRDNLSEEEPGKIVHEIRSVDDPIAQKLTVELGWKWPYYGSIDATPLFIRLLVAYTKEYEPSFLSTTFSDQNNQSRTMGDALAAALQWLKNKVDSNPEGLVESRRLNTPGGIINQVWKDSPDAYHHHDGTLANRDAGVASIEVQALVYDALLDAAEIYEQDPTAQSAIGDLKRRAQKIKNILWEKFWIENNHQGYFALGSDRDPQGNVRPLRVKTSNMGHLLDSRLLEEEGQSTTQKLEQVITTLFSPTLLHACGIRTLASDENRFRPNAYHNGSVWLWDTYKIALGLKRHSYHKQAQDLEQRILKTVQVTKRFPEFVSGDDQKDYFLPEQVIKVFDTKYNFTNTVEQPPQEIQAWTVASVVAIQHQKSALRL